MSSTLLTDLAAYWKLDEASGQRNDSVATRHLADVNGVTQGAAIAANTVNSASFASASSQYLRRAIDAELTVGDIDFTVACWLRMASKTADMVAVAHYLSAGDQRAWNISYRQASDRLRLGLTSNGTAGTFVELYAGTLGSPALNTPYLCVIWHNATANTINIQINNGTVDSAAHATGVFSSTGDFTIGAIANPLQYWDGLVDEVGLWKRVLTADERTKLYNAGAGVTYPDFGEASLALTAPTSYRTYQRNSNNQADIAISGTYVGAPTAIEASWNGGDWTTLDAAPAGGAYSGTLTNQSAGQGTLTVRFANDTGVTATVAYVGIGDIYAIAGQSNASGRGENNQSYSHGTLKASLFGNDYAWHELTDPTDSIVDQVDAVSQEPAAPPSGSIWPLLATALMTATGVPVAFVPGALGGSSITSWLPGADHLNRATLYGSLHYRCDQIGGVKAWLWWQGEADTAMSEATYNGHLDTLANAIRTDMGVKIMPCKLQDCGDGLDETNVNNAIGTAWTDNSNVLRGPDLHGIVADENVWDGVTYHVHIVSDAKLRQVSDLWAVAMMTAIYTGGGGRRPRLWSLS